MWILEIKYFKQNILRLEYIAYKKIQVIYHKIYLFEAQSM